MKQSIYFLFLCLLTINAGAQNKPKLTEINFLVSGQSVETTANGDVTVELTFDRSMNQSINPDVRFGLSAPFTLTVPAVGQGWISATLWQGFFTVSNNNPQTGDGKYVFQIFNAEDLDGVKMDTALSSDAGLEKSLFICRTGELSLSTNALDFGTLNAGTEKLLSLTITNSSCADLHILNVNLPSPFSLVNSTSAFTIAGESSRTLTISFQPNTRTSYSKTLTITSDDRNQATHTVQLTGSAHGPQLDLSPTSLMSYGKVEVGFKVDKTVAITNISAADPAFSDTLHLSNITTNEAVYTVSPSTLNVPPGATKNVQVTFTPTNYQSYNGRILSFFHDDLTQSRPRTIVINGDSRDEAPPTSLSNLTVSWDGFSGLTNAAHLAICWDNPNDPTGIAEIWWKFVKSQAPPQSKNDTTSAGGRLVIPNGTTCASLPLFGKLSTGLWYCYVWLVDGSGNSGYANAVKTSFVYDVTPPGIPTILSRTIKASHWFGRNRNFSLTLGIPDDLFLGTKDASEVRWRYQTPPTTVDDYAARYIFQPSDPENITIAVNFDSQELCGDDSLYIWLADSTGNVSINDVAIARYRFDMCPPKITRVLADEKNIAKLGEAYLDTVVITDDVEIDTAWVKYRFGGADAEEPPRTMTRIADSDSFVVEIPAAGVTRRGVEFTIIAVDSLGNEGNGPTTSEFCAGKDDNNEFWFPVRIRVDGDFRIDKDGRPVSLISGEDVSNYQLFSVPYDLDTTEVMKVLEDDLGAYDKTMWRFFDYKTDNDESARFLEGSDARAFTPGRSYFIVTRQENIIVDSGPGVTRRTVCNDTIRVYEGWNLIATPFNFPVGRESLHLVNTGSDNDAGISLRSYERGWNIVDVMDTWKGYAFFVTKARDSSVETPIYLVVEPKAVPGRVAKASAPFELQPGDWRIQISGRAGEQRDVENWAGVQMNATHAYDKFELAEPPVIGQYLSLAFPHPEWRLAVDNFSTDIRPAVEQEQVWEFEVKTNLPKTEVRLSFNFIGDFPKEPEVHLLDDALQLSQNLRVNTEYSFQSGSQGSTKRLKLIVGSQEFALKQAGDVGLAPEKFELLQNFPNPFNPETSIRYNLAEATKVTFEIFDLLGRKVSTLVDNQHQEIGFYTVSWNGRDRNGKPAASGVYIYRITTESQTFTRKMILMK